MPGAAAFPGVMSIMMGENTQISDYLNFRCFLGSFGRVGVLLRFCDPDKEKGIRKRIKDRRIWFYEGHFKEEIEQTSESYFSS